MSDEFLCIAVPVTQESRGIIVVASFTPPFPSQEWFDLLAPQGRPCVPQELSYGALERDAIFS